MYLKKEGYPRLQFDQFVFKGCCKSAKLKRKKAYKIFLQLFFEGEVNIAEYLPRRSRGKYLAIYLVKYLAIQAEPEENNCFSKIFKRECEKLAENLVKHEKQMSLSLAIMPRNPIITAVIIMQNCYIHL